MISRQFIRQCSTPRAMRQAISKQSISSLRPATATAGFHAPASTTQCQSPPLAHRAFHVAASRRKRQSAPAQPPPTDFGELDVLGNMPVPSTSVDVCMFDGFGLNSGITITDGNGVLLVDGEVFRWRPWEAKGSLNLVNQKGQLDLPAEAFSVFELLWPRPDMLIIGVGKSIVPLSPETRRHVANLGIRVEVLDTRNAAAQFNLLATERGVSDVAAALIPIGWTEGVGAK